MRAIWLVPGIGLSLNIVMLSISIFLSGETEFMLRAERQLRGPAAYVMGAGYLALAISLLAACLLGANIGPKRELRVLRNVSFFCFGVAFALAATLGVHRVLIGLAL